MEYLITILYFTALVLDQKDKLKDLRVFSVDKKSRYLRWKTWANFEKAFFFLAMGIFQIPFVKKNFPFNWGDFCLSIGISVAFFEMATNLALGQSLFFIGSSSKFDAIKKWKWVIVGAILALSIFIKIKI